MAVIKVTWDNDSLWIREQIIVAVALSTSGLQEETLDPFAREFIIEDATPGETYMIKVAAVSSKGEAFSAANVTVKVPKQ